MYSFPNTMRHQSLLISGPKYPRQITSSPSITTSLIKANIISHLDLCNSLLTILTIGNIHSHLFDICSPCIIHSDIFPMQICFSPYEWLLA